MVFLSVLVFLGFIVLYPLLLMLINSFVISRPQQEVKYGLDAWVFAVNDKGMLKALWNSIWVMAWQQGISYPLAIVICWLLARTNTPWSRGLEFLFWVAFFLPVISMIQGWILLLHPTAGLANTAITWLPGVNHGPFNIYSFWGIVFTHLFTHSIAIKVMILTPAFRNMDAALEDASRISGAGNLRTLARVTLPVLLPALSVMFLLSFIRAFQSVEIELILGLPIKFFVFGSKIFDLTRTEPPMFGAATAMGVIVLAGILPLILYQRKLTTRRRYTTITGQYKANILDLREWKWPAFGFILFFGLMVTLVPIIFLLLGTFMKLYGFFEVPGGAYTTKWWSTILTDSVFIRSVKNTLFLALGGATLSTVFLTFLAYVLVRARVPGRPMADFLTWVPSALPGILIALAWLYIFIRTPFLRPLHGSIFALIIVSSVGGITLGVQILKANLLQMGAELEEASQVSGSSLFTTLRKVVVPLILPTMMVVWIIHFVFAASSAIVPALLATPASRPLALLQLEHVMSGQNEAASVVGVLVVVLTVGVAFAARMFGLKVGLGRGAGV
jgi:iron(III) transport system permease protein